MHELKAWEVHNGWKDVPLKSLKPTAKNFGIKIIEVNREDMNSLTPSERTAYVLSDVHATLEIAKIIGVVP